jgi:hypothetical protein
MGDDDDDGECGKEFEAIGLETFVLVLGGLILWAIVTLWKSIRTFIF